MPINIELFQPKTSPPKMAAQTLTLGGGLYWHLFPYFEKLATQCGQMIELYDDANFSSESLGLLDGILSQVLQDLKQQPDRWDQKTGTQVHPVPKVLAESISKQDVSSFVCSLRSLITKAIEVRGVITFTGD